MFVLPNLYIDNITPRDRIQKWDFWEVTRLEKGHEDGVLKVELREETREYALSLSVHCVRKQ